MLQDKQKEVAFFNQHAQSQEYNVFTDASNYKLIKACVDLGGWLPGTQVMDCGCGSGVFTKLLQDFGFVASGLDLSEGLIDLAGRLYPGIKFIVGDIEQLPLESESLDAILLSGIIHHLPDPSKCAHEVYRVLKPGGSFVAFDPNRRNPFMWLYRDQDSPFYSSEGVTENERPIVASKVAQTFTHAGFNVSTRYLSGLHYRYIASARMRRLLPIYNFLDEVLFQLPFLKPYSAFVLTRGVK
ncbi:class I SAM-dependent methyltransferase [Kovacikia minuta CCNUW1]|uniref:class I SAM-dependent methyltransferase n=1 Tax=Kovacikia minuta TaxID=2931930 RepID=UPI001CCC0D63|nr:class I SAM-dependent methyltransferase [Kovacikia minuta]UBF28453.1 class I SAM-dependent methyltransferase [Kovacikia minuta CCNUW1]